MDKNYLEENSVSNLVAALAQRLITKQWMAATAESCTGGGIAAALTDLVGSSTWFDAGFITYSNAAKQRMLGVSPEHFHESACGGHIGVFFACQIYIWENQIAWRAAQALWRRPMTPQTLFIDCKEKSRLWPLKL